MQQKVFVEFDVKRMDPNRLKGGCKRKLDEVFVSVMLFCG